MSFSPLGASTSPVRYPGVASFISFECCSFLTCLWHVVVPEQGSQSICIDPHAAMPWVLQNSLQWTGTRLRSPCHSGTARFRAENAHWTWATCSRLPCRHPSDSHCRRGNTQRCKAPYEMRQGVIHVDSCVESRSRDVGAQRLRDLVSVSTFRHASSREANHTASMEVLARGLTLCLTGKSSWPLQTTSRQRQTPSALCPHANASGIVGMAKRLSRWTATQFATAVIG